MRADWPLWSIRHDIWAGRCEAPGHARCPAMSKFAGSACARHAALLTSSVVACSETASCAVQWRMKCSMSGTRPTVDTVTCTATRNGGGAANPRPYSYTACPAGSMGAIRATYEQTPSAGACLIMGEVQAQGVAQDVHCCQDGVRVVHRLPHSHEDDVGDGGCSRHSSCLSGKLQQGREALRMPPHRAGVPLMPSDSGGVGSCSTRSRRRGSMDTEWTAANAAAGAGGPMSRSGVE